MAVRAISIWLLIMLVETLHGILRGIFLVPLTGQIRANQIGVGIGSILIFIITLITIKWLKTDRPVDLFIIGLLWVLLTIIFEISPGYATGGWERVLTDYDLRQGGLMPFGLLIMMLSPLAAIRLGR